MAIPPPTPGLVIRYEYLWKHEHLAGREVGAKDRPACIVLAVADGGEGPRVLILPVTRQPPPTGTLAREIPAAVKRHLGLDGSRSWIVLSEGNLDVWPSPDMRQIPGKPGMFVYGLLPERLVNDLRHDILSAISRKSLAVARRID